MTTLALEGAALEQTPPNSWDVMPVPNDFAVTVTSESRGHQTSFRTIEASWDNEGKVIVLITGEKMFGQLKNNRPNID
jgi:hypothetical protein